MKSKTPQKKTVKKSAKPKAAGAPQETRNQLLTTALRHFAQNGFKAASIHEIAKDAGVNVSLVSYYFGSKQGLFKTCFEKVGSDRLAHMKRMLSHEPSSTEDVKLRLAMIIDEMIIESLKNPEIHTILHRDLEGEFALVEEEFKNTFLQVFQTIVDFLSKAQSKNLISSFVDPMKIVLVLTGSIIQVLKTDHIGKKFFGKTIQQEDTRHQFRDQIIQIIFEGITPHKKLD